MAYFAMSPPHDARPHMKHFSKGLESVRKDVECTFGTYESFLKSVLYIYAFTPFPGGGPEAPLERA